MFSNASGSAFCTRGGYSEGGAANSKWLILSREQHEKIGLCPSAAYYFPPEVGTYQWIDKRSFPDNAVIQRSGDISMATTTAEVKDKELFGSDES